MTTKACFTSPWTRRVALIESIATNWIGGHVDHPEGEAAQERRGGVGAQRSGELHERQQLLHAILRLPPRAPQLMVAAAEEDVLELTHQQSEDLLQLVCQILLMLYQQPVVDMET